MLLAAFPPRLDLPFGVPLPLLFLGGGFDALAFLGPPALGCGSTLSKALVGGALACARHRLPLPLGFPLPFAMWTTE